MKLEIAIVPSDPGN